MRPSLLRLPHLSRSAPTTRAALAAGLVLACAAGSAVAGASADAAGSGTAAARPAAAGARSVARVAAAATPSTTSRTTVADCFPGCRLLTEGFEDGSADGWTTWFGDPAPVSTKVAASGTSSLGELAVADNGGPTRVVDSVGLRSPLGYWYAVTAKVRGSQTRGLKVQLTVTGAKDVVPEPQSLGSNTSWITLRTWFRSSGGPITIGVRNAPRTGPTTGETLQGLYLDDVVVEVPTAQPTGTPTTTKRPRIPCPTPSGATATGTGKCVVFSSVFATVDELAPWSHSGDGELSLRREGGAWMLNSLQATLVSTTGGPVLTLDDPLYDNPDGRWFQVQLKVRVDAGAPKARVRLQVEGAELAETTELQAGPRFRVVKAWFKPSGPVRIGVVAAPSTCVKPQHVLDALMLDDVSVAIPGQGKAPTGTPTTPAATCW